MPAKCRATVYDDGPILSHHEVDISSPVMHPLAIPLSDKCLNPLKPLSPHDAPKHHVTFLKTDLIFLQKMGLERKFL